MIRKQLKRLKRASARLFRPQELTETHIRLAYRLIFGRAADSDRLIKEKLGLKSIAALRQEMVGSAEFANILNAQSRLCGMSVPSDAKQSFTAEHVNLGYRFILGRAPESEAVAEGKLATGSVEALRKVLLNSPEFFRSTQDGSIFAQNTPLQPTVTARAGLPEIPRSLGAKLKHLNMLLIGTCTLEPIVEAGPRLGYKVRHLLMKSTASAAVPTVSTEDVDVVVVGLTLRHLLQTAVEGTPGLSGDTAFLRLAGNEALADELIERTKQAIAEKLDGLSATLKDTPTLFLSFLEPSFHYAGALLDRADPTSPTQMVRRLNVQLHQMLKAFPNFHLLDTNEIANMIGRMHLQDDVIWVGTHASVIGDFDFGNDQNRIVRPTLVYKTYQAESHRRLFGEALCCAVADNLTILRGTDRVKLVVVDLDDTLWRGVAADQSSLGTEEQTEGWPLGFIEALLYFKQRGGLLAVCSKNTEAPTLARWAKMWPNKICAEDFVSIKINWDEKSKNIAAILAETNLLPESVVFIDDNPREIAEVRAQFPTLRCLSADHMDWRRILLRSPQTQVATVTAESRARTALVKARVAREEQALTVPREEFLLSLKIEQSFLLLRSSKDPNFARGFELLNKTNQFNTTGKRWSVSELEAYFRDGGLCLLSALKDKTVDNGIIGAALVKHGVITQTVLSCRIFGLGAEICLGRVATQLALQSSETARAQVIDTGKNFTCHTYFESLGFQKQGDFFEAQAPCLAPAWIDFKSAALDALLRRAAFADQPVLA